MNPVEEIPCATAKEFLEKLSPTAAPFFGATYGGWIYRGHGDADRWKLLPSARRSPTLLERLNFFAGRGPPVTKALANEMVAEFDVIRVFYQRCHDRGFPVPEDCFELRNTMTNWRGSGPKISIPPISLEGAQGWPDPRLLPLVALAQHFRLPTCLLDWTRRSFVAAFFAATATLELQRKKMDRSGKLCVWAFQQGAKSALDHHEPMAPDDPMALKRTPSGPGVEVKRWRVFPGPFEVVTPPE